MQDDQQPLYDIRIGIGYKEVYVRIVSELKKWTGKSLGATLQICGY